MLFLKKIKNWYIIKTKHKKTTPHEKFTISTLFWWDYAYVVNYGAAAYELWIFNLRIMTLILLKMCVNLLKIR